MVPSTLNHRLKEKKRKREFGQEEKTMKRIRCCVIGVFGSQRMHSCVKHEKTGECMDKKGVMVEEWKARRKEWKKKRWKKGKREKSGFGKSPFWFLFDCVFASSLFPCTHHSITSQHMLTLIHHPPYNMTHWCTPSHANRIVCCAAFFGNGQQDTLHHPHPTLHHLTSHNTHQQTQHRHSSWCKQQQEDNWR